MNAIHILQCHREDSQILQGHNITAWIQLLKVRRIFFEYKYFKNTIYTQKYLFLMDSVDHWTFLHPQSFIKYMQQIQNIHNKHMYYDTKYIEYF